MTTEMLWFNTSSGKIEIQMTLEQAESISHQGRCDADVAKGRKVPELVAQLDKVDPELLRQELREYGAWDDAELQDHDVNLTRLLWLAAGDVAEEARQADR